MAADGTWKIDLKTPMGAQAVTLVLVTDGGALSGSLAERDGRRRLHRRHRRRRHPRGR